MENTARHRKGNRSGKLGAFAANASGRPGSIKLQIGSFKAAAGVPVPLGIPDEFAEQGGQSVLKKKYFPAKEGIYAALSFLMETSAEGSLRD